MGFLPWIALGMIVKILAKVIAEKLVAVVAGIVGYGPPVAIRDRDSARGPLSAKGRHRIRTACTSSLIGGLP
jgi:hypothetical protein